MNKKYYKYFGIGAIVGFNLLLNELYEDAFAYAFDRHPPAYLVKLVDSPSHEPWYYPIRDAAAERARNIPHSVFTRLSSTGEKLRGYFFPCERKNSKSRKIAFIVHGYRSEYAETLGMYYDLYHDRGFDVFIADNRASGQSDGRYITFNLMESEDTLGWLNDLVGAFGEQTQIILHGFSMGGATVLKCSDRVPKQVKVIISDSGFSNAEGTLRPGFGVFYNLFQWKFKRTTGLDLRNSDVKRNLKHALCPIIFVHGRKDPTVPFSMGEELYELCPTKKYRLFNTDAMHIEVMYRDPDGYKAVIDEAISNHFRKD